MKLWLASLFLQYVHVILSSVHARLVLSPGIRCWHCDCVCITTKGKMSHNDTISSVNVTSVTEKRVCKYFYWQMHSVSGHFRGKNVYPVKSNNNFRNYSSMWMCSTKCVGGDLFLCLFIIFKIYSNLFIYLLQLEFPLLLQLWVVPVQGFLHQFSTVFCAPTSYCSWQV